MRLVATMLDSAAAIASWPLAFTLKELSLNYRRLIAKLVFCFTFKLSNKNLKIYIISLTPLFN